MDGKFIFDCLKEAIKISEMLRDLFRRVKKWIMHVTLYETYGWTTCKIRLRWQMAIERTNKHEFESRFWHRAARLLRRSRVVGVASNDDWRKISFGSHRFPRFSLDVNRLELSSFLRRWSLGFELLCDMHVTKIMMLKWSRGELRGKRRWEVVGGFIVEALSFGHSQDFWFDLQQWMFWNDLLEI
jgi:hypothetical protein